MLLSHVWMDSPLRLADSEAHPDHIVRAIVEVLTGQNPVQQNKIRNKTKIYTRPLKYNNKKQPQKKRELGR